MNTNNSAARKRQVLQVLPLACLAALSMVTADVNASSVTSDEYLVPIGSTSTSRT